VWTAGCQGWVGSEDKYYGGGDGDCYEHVDDDEYDGCAEYDVDVNDGDAYRQWRGEARSPVYCATGGLACTSSASCSYSCATVCRLLWRSLLWSGRGVSSRPVDRSAGLRLEMKSHVRMLLGGPTCQLMALEYRQQTMQSSESICLITHKSIQSTKHWSGDRSSTSAGLVTNQTKTVGRMAVITPPTTCAAKSQMEITGYV
jgi:hypothetical protein